MAHERVKREDDPDFGSWKNSIGLAQSDQVSWLMRQGVKLDDGGFSFAKKLTDGPDFWDENLCFIKQLYF